MLRLLSILLLVAVSYGALAGEHHNESPSRFQAGLVNSRILELHPMKEKYRNKRYALYPLVTPCMNDCPYPTVRPVLYPTVIPIQYPTLRPLPVPTLRPVYPTLRPVPYPTYSPLPYPTIGYGASNY